MGRSKSRRLQEASRSNPPAEEVLPDVAHADPDAPPPPPTGKQKLALAGMVVVMAAWLTFLGLLVRK
jgi:hypothetical protein